MKRLLAVVLVGAGLCSFLVWTQATSGEIKGKDCFFLKSLHYTANGMGYWYSKERGGLELLTGIPYENLGCKNCHTPGCDTCHAVEKTINECSVYAYSTDAASNQAMCLKCHGREKAMIQIDHKANQDDVHVAQGMVCVDCHSQREMHGDGKDYVSLKEPGAMDTQCENCHDEVKPTEAHTVHNEKLDCKACHVRHVVSCTNCHFNTLVKEGKRKAIPVSGWLFLMNYKDKVSSASMQTFVTEGNKTFLMFAPHMSHSVMKQGRACEECHAAENVRRVKEGAIDLTWLKDGKTANQKGVIPVVEGVDYRCVYQDLQDGNWIPIQNAPKPLLQYVAFGKPLTQEQLEKLLKTQEAPTPKME